MAGGGCECVGACNYPDDQTVDEGDSWTQHIAGRYETPALFSFCTNKFNAYIEIDDGGWKNMDDTTPIKLVSGLLPQSIDGQTGGCNAQNTPRATFGLQAAIGSGGSTYHCRGRIDDGIGVFDDYTYFDITVNSSGVGQVINVITS